MAPENPYSPGPGNGYDPGILNRLSGSRHSKCSMFCLSLYGPVPILSLRNEIFLNGFLLALESGSQLSAGGGNIVSAFGTYGVADTVFVEDGAERANGLAGRWPVVG